MKYLKDKYRGKYSMTSIRYYVPFWGGSNTVQSVSDAVATSANTINF
jgi:hypothetical protein